LFCKLIEAIEPGTITGKLNEEPKNQFEINENLDQVIAGSKKLGCNIVNVGPNDFVEGRKHLILGVFWQIVRVGLLKSVMDLSAKFNAELSMGLPPEQILLMWLNHHLKVAGLNRVATNFGDDLRDSVILTYVLNQLDPHHCDLSGLKLEDPEQAAESVLVSAEKLGCRKFISAEDIVKGNARVNLAFVATLFSKYPEMGLTGRALELFEDNKKLKMAYEEIVEEKKILETNWLVKKKAKTSAEEMLVKEIEKLKMVIIHERQEREEENERYAKEMETEKEKLENEKKLKLEVDEKYSREIELLRKELEEEKQSKLEIMEKYAEKVEYLKEQLEEERQVRAQREEKYQKKLEYLKQELEEREELLEKYAQKVAYLKEQMQADRERWEEEKNALMEENQSLREQLVAALQKIKKLEAKVANLKSERDKLSSQLSSLQSHLGSSQNDANKLEKEYRAVAEELSLTQAKLTEAEHSLKQQEKEIATLYIEIEDVKNELLKSVDALGLLEGQKDAVTKLLENDEKVGFLYKKSPNTKLGIKLQKRFFVLRGGNLYYYKSDKEYASTSRAHPTGVIPLDNISLTVYTDEQSKKRNWHFKWMGD